MKRKKKERRPPVALFFNEKQLKRLKKGLTVKEALDLIGGVSAAVYDALKLCQRADRHAI
jgi:hypothetical protein